MRHKIELLFLIVGLIALSFTASAQQARIVYVGIFDTTP